MGTTTGVCQVPVSLDTWPEFLLKWAHGTELSDRPQFWSRHSDCFVKWQVVVIQTSSDSDWVRLKSTACLSLSQARERFQIWLGLGGRPHWLGVWVGREQFIVALSWSGDKGVCLDVEPLVESGSRQTTFNLGIHARLTLTSAGPVPGVRLVLNWSQIVTSCTSLSGTSEVSLGRLEWDVRISVMRDWLPRVLM